MFRSLLNWKTLLSLLAIAIVIGTIFYSQYLSQKIALRERQMVEYWVEASAFVNRASMDADFSVAYLILSENDYIPIIEVDEKDSIISFVNLDSAKAASSKNYLTI